MFTAIVMLLGIYIGYLRLASGSTILAAFAHGLINAQIYGVWQLIFPNVDPLLVGLTGIAGLLVLLPVAAWVLRMSTKFPKIYEA